MARAVLLASFVLLGMAALAADEIETVELDFLDYLGSMESDDDNWTLLDDTDGKPATKDAEAAQKAAAARKSSKEAAKPAVEER